MNLKVNSFSKNTSKQRTQVPTFGAGLTSKMMQEIQYADVLEISNRLTKKGIPSDFKDNKVLAWCCDKTVGIIEQLNKKYNLKLGLPKAIYVEDFYQIDPEIGYSPGFCNPLPGKVFKNSDRKEKPLCLFFNNFKTAKSTVPPKDVWLLDWDNINDIIDAQFKSKQTSSDFFLYPVLHEFSHVIHQSNFMKRLNKKELIARTSDAVSPGMLEVFSDKYGYKMSQICDYASTSPVEAVACDIPRLIIGALDKETLTPVENPFLGSSYEKIGFLKSLNMPVSIDSDRPLKDILRNFWNGNFD